MKLKNIGKNIKKYRTERNMTQENLAELANLSVTYTGLVERGKKIPALATFVKIANALDVSADMLLCDVLNKGSEIRSSDVFDRISRLPDDEQERIYDVIETMLRHAKERD